MEHEDEKASAKSSWKEKWKSSKQLQIIVAVAVALVAIAIYFGVSSLGGVSETGKPVCSGNDDTAKRIAAILSDMEQVGDCSVMITYDEKKPSGADIGNHIVGVVVVAQGGSDMRVKLRIIDAVCALLDVEGSKIKVYQMK